MRRVVALLVALSLGGLVAPAQAAAPLRTLTGVVTSSIDGQRLEGIEVCVERTVGGQRESRCALSDATGSYRLRAPEGRHRLLARTPYRYGAWASQEWPGRAVTVAPRGSRADVVMRPGADIFVDLVSPSGPIHESTGLYVYRVDAEGRVAEEETTFSNLAIDEDDPRRAFADLARLQPGRYVVQVRSPDENVHARTWYPDAATSREAQVVELSEGEQLRLPDMVLQEPAALVITARTPGGERLQPWQVQVLDAAGREMAVTTGTQRAVARNLPAGTYRYRVVENRRTLRYAQWRTGVVVPRGGRVESTITMRWRTPKVTTRPGIRHDGNQITMTRGPRWSPTMRYHWDDVHWYRDGRRTDWVGRTYVPEKRDVGHRLQVCVAAVRIGWGRSLACSASYRPRSTDTDR